MICAITYTDLANAVAVSAMIGAVIGIVFTLWIGSLDLGGKP